MKKKLGVENLTISFRTVNGNVQAVRDISFNLYEGETLCIVGESGSGKSVTSRAILGILAKNAIVQGGKIFYDGKNLLKIKSRNSFCSGLFLLRDKFNDGTGWRIFYFDAHFSQLSFQGICFSPIFSQSIFLAFVNQSLLFGG